jgi:hypothetical protein
MMTKLAIAGAALIIMTGAALADKRLPKHDCPATFAAQWRKFDSREAMVRRGAMPKEPCWLKHFRGLMSAITADA